MKIKDIVPSVLKELDEALSSIDETQAQNLVNAIIAADKIFTAGAGRSLLMIRGLAMRLMQLGFTSYVAGETVTPAIRADDLLIIGSGSGETGALAVMAQKAKNTGAKLALITIYPESTIGRLSDLVVRIRAATSKNDKGVKSVQPGANMFEQSLLLFCDALVIKAMEQCGIEQGLLMKNHANLE
ncbi:MAG: 6-phospho-3-hexuloisomerase [Treponema sp.]|jgi:6-phospho-3-hexuloisomerase|nr:6-phospho-3-hexuloisomerase [Treponema sp.]